MSHSLSSGFRFGIEAEFLICKKSNWQPLWYKDLSFIQLNQIFEGIDLSGLPSLEGLELELPAKKCMPFVVEGYHLPNMDSEAHELLPKGVEIRTPVCESIEECIDVFSSLHKRLSIALASIDLVLVSLSHHPTESHFSGPQNKRRHDYWQWSMEVMTTYGPDINISLPDSLSKELDLSDLEAKINYYGPALSALSVASPFQGGKLWEIRGSVGQSFRMHKRSYIAPPVEFHPNERNRLEFKVFDMPTSNSEWRAQFQSFLTLTLDDTLKGRASKQSRIYDLGQVARFGIQAETVKERAKEILSKAPEVLRAWGFSSKDLGIFVERVELERSPADEMIRFFQESGSLSEVLKARSEWKYD